MAKKKIDLNNEIDRLLSPEVRKELDKAPPSPAFQQFLIRYLDVRDSVIINFIADNDQFAERIANKVRGHVAESYDQLAAVLFDIKTGQVDTNKKLVQIETKVMEHDTNLLKLQDDINILKTRNTLASYTIRGIIYIAIAIILFLFLFPWAHKHLSYFTNQKEGYSKEWSSEEQLRVLNAPTRAIHYNNLSDAQKDSLIEDNEQGIERQIEERNKSSKQ